MQFDLFRQLMDELVAWKTNYMIFMAPLPKYLEAGCCSDGDHVANRREPDFRQKLEEAVFNSRTNIKNFAFRVGLRKCTTISTWGKIRKLSGLWRDEVCVSDEAYHIIGQAILEAAAELVKKRPTAATRNLVWRLLQAEVGAEAGEEASPQLERVRPEGTAALGGSSEAEEAGEEAAIEATTPEDAAEEEAAIESLNM
jgi:hypothetical protein